ncbi:MAG TPA: acyl carrier protein [Anaerolineales bacterium]
MRINSSPELDRRIQAMLAEALQIEPALATPDLAFGDLPQWDSLGHMELMMRLEQEFGVEMDTDLIAQLTSFNAIHDFLLSKRQDG